MINLTNIQVIFNQGTVLETPALQGIDLDVRKREFLTVVGSNGAGKSTLLSVLSGELACTKGSIRINNQDVTSQPVHKRAKLAARVFQDPLAGTCASLTIEENLSLALSRGKFRGLSLFINKAKRELFRDRLAILGLGLEDRLSDRIGLLSGGQRQAVSLIMATLAESEILLLDEHTAALDPRMAAFIIDLTQKIYEECQLTVLMVTHSMKDALACGQRTVMLHEGKIVLDINGPARKGMTVERLLKLFNEVRSEELMNGSLLIS